MIQGHIFFIDLMEFPFYWFNIILGMDWLTEHRAKINFTLKRVTLGTDEGMEIIEVGEQTQFLSNLVLAIKVEKLIGKCCEAYLAYVMSLQE